MTIEQREQLRVAVLNFLAPRHVAAFSAAQIANRLRVSRELDFALTDADVNDACGVLLKLELVNQVAELAFAILPHYQVTGKGIIESEKWRAARGLE